MAQENYVEGCSMQRPPLLSSKTAIFYFEVEDEETKLMKETPYGLLKDEQKKKLGKNNEAKMTLYNALPRKEYGRVFRGIRYFPRIRQDQDHCLNLKNTSYPHQQILRIRYFGQHYEETRFPSNTPYPEAPIRRIQWRLMRIQEYYNRGAHSELS
ncbi:hypothetical protein Tco_0319180 [Tanacetum coccineum]